MWYQAIPDIFLVVSILSPMDQMFTMGSQKITPRMYDKYMFTFDSFTFLCNISCLLCRSAIGLYMSHDHYVTSIIWLVNKFYLPTKTVVLMSREGVLTNHDKVDIMVMWHIVESYSSGTLIWYNNLVKQF